MFGCGARSFKKKLIALSEVNQVTIMWVPGNSSITVERETTDRLVREGSGTRPIIPRLLTTILEQI